MQETPLTAQDRRHREVLVPGVPELRPSQAPTRFVEFVSAQS